MNDDQKGQYMASFELAVRYAIEQMGISHFKETSFFGFRGMHKEIKQAA